MPQLWEWQSEARRDSPDLQKGHAAILFLIPDAPRRVV